MIEEWIRVRSFLIPAIELLGGTHNETDVLAMVLAGRAKLWSLPNSALVTEICQYPRLKEVSIVVAGGNKDELIGMNQTLEDHAREMGCQRVRQSGRWGWRKWEGEQTGFRFLNTTIVKDI